MLAAARSCAAVVVINLSGNAEITGTLQSDGGAP